MPRLVWCRVARLSGAVQDDKDACQHFAWQQAAGDKRSRNCLNQLIRASLFLKLHLTRVPRGMGHASSADWGVGAT